MRRALLLAATTVLSLSLPAAAQEPAAPSGHSLHGEAFDEGPRQQARLLDGMGDIKFPVTSKSSDAQRFIEQGLAQVHTFYYFEAERSFRQAAFLDPDCAMAYWGMALANQNNHKRGLAFIRKANDRAAAVTDRERKYIDALTAYFAEGKDDRARREDHVKGLESVVLAYPDDIEAKALLAWAIIGSSWGGPKLSSRVAVNFLIEEVLRHSPLHPGAHHYRIHLWDGSDPAQALASAEAYARAATGIAHAWHMPGHIYNGLARWREAAYQQEGSARVDHAHLLAAGTMPFEIHNYVHNQNYLIANLVHLGRVQDAIELARNLVEQPRDPRRNEKGDGGSAQRTGRFCLLKTYVRFELWDNLLEDPHLDWSDAREEKAWEAFGRGLALLGKGDQSGARSASGDLDRIAAEAAKKPGRDADLIEAARSELAGRLAVAEGRLLEGFGLLDRGAKLQSEKLDGDLGPYPRPIHEACGFAHLEARNWGLAEACFRHVLEKRKNTVVSAAGLVEALYRKGALDEAADAHHTFLLAAADADAGLPLARRIEPIAIVLMADRPDHTVAAVGGDQSTVSSHPLIDLETLGPKTWLPSPAPEIALADAKDETVILSSLRGKPVVLLFYLGNACAHCRDQLKAFAKEKKAFDDLGAAVLAVSADTPEMNRAFLAGPDGPSVPFTLLSDPGRKAAKLYGAHDTFEDIPLHGVVLIDPEGKVRWSRASAEPFTDVAFVLSETARVMKILDGRRKTRV